VVVVPPSSDAASAGARSRITHANFVMIQYAVFVRQPAKEKEMGKSRNRSGLLEYKS
jgi:hypothetical protein